MDIVCAPSFYGEVPADMWEVATLFPPGSDAFGAYARASLAAAAAAQPVQPARPREERAEPAPSIGPFRPGGRGSSSARSGPYDRPSSSSSSSAKGGEGGGGKGGGGKGGGGKGGKGDGGKGKGGKGDAISRGAPPHVLRFEASRAMGLGLVGGSSKTGGGMKETKNPWDGRRA